MNQAARNLEETVFWWADIDAGHISGIVVVVWNWFGKYCLKMLSCICLCATSGILDINA